MLAGILGSFENDLLFVVVALLLFGRRLPEVASSLGRKAYQFRRGLDEMKSQITQPLRESIEAPLRDAADSTRAAFRDADRDIRAAANEARIDRMVEGRFHEARTGSIAAGAPAGAVPGAGTTSPMDSSTTTLSPSASPFPYPGSTRPGLIKGMEPETDSGPKA